MLCPDSISLCTRTALAVMFCKSSHISSVMKWRDQRHPVCFARTVCLRIRSVFFVPLVALDKTLKVSHRTLNTIVPNR